MRRDDGVPMVPLVARTGRRWRWSLQLAQSGLTIDRGTADTLNDCKTAAAVHGWEANRG